MITEAKASKFFPPAPSHLLRW